MSGPRGPYQRRQADNVSRVGTLLEHHRRDREIQTRQEMGRLIGDETNYGKIIRGIDRLSDDRARRIAKALDLAEHERDELIAAAHLDQQEQASRQIAELQTSAQALADMAQIVGLPIPGPRLEQIVEVTERAMEEPPMGQALVALQHQISPVFTDVWHALLNAGLDPEQLR
jgi:hypothetical protein